MLGTAGPAWPADLRLAPRLDGDAVARALRAAEARFGPVTLGHAVAVDEAGAVTWRLIGDRGELELKVGIDPDSGALTVVAFVPKPMEPPLHAI